MPRGNSSGLKVTAKELPTIIGMINRGDRHHDIAAWFGLNQGRIKDAQDGKYGAPQATAGAPLPPKGPPGLKGRRLREAVTAALALLATGNTSGGIDGLKKATGNYDANEA